MITRDRSVASSNTVFVSSISTQKVLLPCRIRSSAPRRVKILSTGVMMSDSAGTKEPIWARITAMHTYRSRVDFPPILGPVSSNIRGLLGQPRNVSFGMKPEEAVLFYAAADFKPSSIWYAAGSPGLKVRVTPGWRICFSSRTGLPSEARNLGLHTPPWQVLAKIAREHKQSSSAMQLTILCQICFFVWKWANMEHMNGIKAFLLCFVAVSICLVRSLRCGVTNL